MTPESFKHYKLNIEHLDKVHWNLLESMDEISHGTADIHFKQLSKDLQHHFQDEEEFMALIGYPYLNHHRKEHAELLDRMYKLSHNPVQSPSYLRALTTLLYDVFIKHIDFSDRQISTFVDSLYI